MAGARGHAVAGEHDGHVFSAHEVVDHRQLGVEEGVDVLAALDLEAQDALALARRVGEHDVGVRADATDEVVALAVARVAPHLEHGRGEDAAYALGRDGQAHVAEDEGLVEGADLGGTDELARGERHARDAMVSGLEG